MNRNLIAAIITAVVAFSTFVFVLPIFSDIGQAKEAKSTREVVLEKRKADLDNFNKLKERFASRQTEIERVKAFLPSKKQIDEVVATIKKVSEESGLQILIFSAYDVDASGSGTAKDYKEVQASVQMAGDYVSFVNFLKSLEQNLRLYDVKDIEISVPANSNGNILNFNAKISTYFVK
jgi:Tfp pilus assembly protein PilO